MHDWDKNMQESLAKAFEELFQKHLIKPEYAEKIIGIIFGLIENGSEDVIHFIHYRLLICGIQLFVLGLNLWNGQYLLKKYCLKYFLLQVSAILLFLEMLLPK